MASITSGRSLLLIYEKYKKIMIIYQPFELVIMEAIFF